MKRLLIITLMLCAFVNTVMAQRITHNFQNVSMSDALKYIQQQTSKHKIIFIYNELEDFMVTTSVKGKSVPEAIKQLIGFYPIRMTQSSDEIYVECTHKSNRHLTGKVVDEKGLPLEFADVRLLNPSDSSYITGGVTNASGIFVIPLDKSQVIAKFSYIGYKPVYKLCSRENVGTIQLQVEVTQLGEVTVKGAKRLVRSTERGLIANVQGTVLENFGSVNDMLSHLPLMMSDGTIAGHGKPEIYINNKKVRDASELERYRADEILSAEIITNPGAEYGAEVTSVIRLKTVRKTGEGWSGNFSTAYRQGKENYANGNVSLNYRTRNGMDFFASGYLTHNNQLYNSTSEDQLQASSVWDYHRKGEWLYHFNYFFGDLGWNWDISEHHSIGMRYTLFSYLGNKPDLRSFEETTWQDGTVLESGDAKTFTTRKPKASHSINAYYVGEVGKWNIDFSADYYRAPSVTEMEGGTIGEPIVSSSSTAMNELLAEKLVVTAPVSKGHLTFGEEVSGVDRSTDFVQSGYAADNHVRQQTTTWALFANYSLTLDKLELTASLRWQNEQNRYDVDGKRNDEMSPDYHVLIPKASVNYQTGNWKHKLTFSTFRNNPSYWSLSSDVHYRSKYEYDMGNPFLKPQTSYQLAWSTQWKWAYVEAYYKYNKNTSRSFQYAYDDENHPGVMVMTYLNSPKRQFYGINFNLSPKIDIWQMNYSASLYFVDEDLAALGITHKWNGLCMDFTLDNTFTLPHSWMLNLKVGLTPYQESCCAQVQTTGFVNIRLSKQFLKDKSLSVAILANDILHTQYMEMTAYSGINVRTQFRQYNDSRRVGIDLSWKFNATRSRYKGGHAGQEERNRL
ncbi:MAG: outer membrane beta-barrel protein [Muribaculaceae bacterium]|nr:outer membrane beta-barrel protein [Muribaculaceae bacterium]MBR0025397.1 outer membrane beta-barrel protein [Muribaculaceae bacterium]